MTFPEECDLFNDAPRPNMCDAQAETEFVLGFFPMNDFYDAGGKPAGYGKSRPKALHEVARASKHECPVLHAQRQAHTHAPAHPLLETGCAVETLQGLDHLWKTLGLIVNTRPQLPAKPLASGYDDGNGHPASRTHRQWRADKACNLREYSSQWTHCGMSDLAQIDDSFTVTQRV
jgi:hypothetical protein